MKGGEAAVGFGSWGGGFCQFDTQFEKMCFSLVKLPRMLQNAHLKTYLHEHKNIIMQQQEKHINASTMWRIHGGVY